MKIRQIIEKSITESVEVLLQEPGKKTKEITGSVFWSLYEDLLDKHGEFFETLLNLKNDQSPHPDSQSELILVETIGLENYVTKYIKTDAFYCAFLGVIKNPVNGTIKLNDWIDAMLKLEPIKITEKRKSELEFIRDNPTELLADLEEASKIIRDLEEHGTECLEISVKVRAENTTGIPDAREIFENALTMFLGTKMRNPESEQDIDDCINYHSPYVFGGLWYALFYNDDRKADLETAEEEGIEQYFSAYDASYAVADQPIFNALTCLLESDPSPANSITLETWCNAMMDPENFHCFANGENVPPHETFSKEIVLVKEHPQETMAYLRELKQLVDDFEKGKLRAKVSLTSVSEPKSSDEEIVS